MHTIFVNTSSNVDMAAHGPLFDDLISSNELIVFNYKLDALDACAEEIARLITRYDEITEEFNVIVYVEVDGTHEAAFAAETAVSIVVRGTLLAGLYKLGRKANNALIIFGENFKRGKRIISEDAYRRALWALFPLPEPGEALEIISKVNDNSPSFEGKNMDETEKYKDAVSEALISGNDDNALLKFNRGYVSGAVRQMAAIFAQRGTFDSESLLDCLDEAVMIREEDNGVEKSITTERPRYAHIRIHDSDFHASCRTEYRILLYIRKYVLDSRDCDGKSKADGFENTERISSFGTNERTYIGEYEIPDIDCGSLSSTLKKKLGEFNETMRAIAASCEEGTFPKYTFDTKEHVIDLSIERPELSAKAKAHKGLKIAQLRRAVNATLKDIEEKSNNDKNAIKSFITKLLSAFNKERDALIESKRDDIMPGNSDETFENDDIAEAYIAQKIDEVDSRIADRERCLMPDARIDEVLKETEIRTDYYFDCLEKGKLIYIIGVAFVLLLAVPYAIIQHSLFATVHGWLFYGISLAVFAAAYSVGYLIFAMTIKSKIVKAIEALCDEFYLIQNEKEACLRQCISLIETDIPMSFLLNQYQNEFRAYKKKKEDDAVRSTYSLGILKKYIEYISSTLQNLDINRMKSTDDSDTDYSWIGIEFNGCGGDQ